MILLTLTHLLLFVLKRNVGSARQSNVALPHTACFRLSSTTTNEYPIIIDSGATHHMWNDGSAFIQFKYLHNCYVTLANNFKIPIKGQGTIQLKINGYLLHIHDVYLVPTLQFSLYSVKQHRKYPQRSCLFDNDAATLNFPKFTFDIDDKYDMLIYGASVSTPPPKIHWSSKDGLHLNARQISSDKLPIPMPGHKPNPNKQVHRKITNIDIHKYLGFRTLKKLKPFRLVAKDTVTFVDAGEITLSHGDFTTIQRHRSNKTEVVRPKHFFDIAHMDITYGDTVAPGGIKSALIIVDRKTRYNFVLPLQNCKSVTIIKALQKLKTMAGKLPRILYTDFDPKLLSNYNLNFQVPHIVTIFHEENGRSNDFILDLKKGLAQIFFIINEPGSLSSTSFTGLNNDSVFITNFQGSFGSLFNVVSSGLMENFVGNMSTFVK